MFEGLEKRVNNRGGVSYWKDGVMVYKKCTKCGEIKTTEAFYLKKKTGKYTPECKDCLSKIGKQYYEKHFKEINERRKEYRERWREENKEYCREWNKQYYEKHKEKILEYKRQWNKDNKEHCSEWGKQYRKEREEYLKEYRKQRYMNNKEEVKAQKKRWRERNPEWVKEYYQNNKQRWRDSGKKGRIKRKEANVIRISNSLEQVNPMFKELNLPTYGVIYKFENIKTGHVYIGQTINLLKDRYRRGIKGWIKERKTYDIQKFKEELIEEDFEVTEILDVGCCQYHLDKLEVYYIDKYDSYNNGYNNNSGKHNTDDGIEEFENILKENNLEFVDGELRRICDER